jgi:UDP-N-acetylglucosamine 2-epimerase (non-hydrolysing)
MKTLYFFIGTKAQAIKCLPVIRSAISSDYKVYIVDSGQHVEIVDSILLEFKNKAVRLNLFKNYQNVSDFKEAVYWFFNFVFRYLFRRTLKTHGVCIIHGDTLSTFLGLLWAKRNNLTILHLESGLTSSKIFNPFPEEIIRRVVSRYSDILICFDLKSKNYLERRFKNKKKSIKKVSENTIIETINKENLEITDGRVTVTLHRTENIVNKKRLQNFVNFLNILSETLEVNWYIHEPTKNYIKKHSIKNLDNLYLHDLIEHNQFINVVKKSELIITDGGSIQEECYFLGKKTLIWRKTTERDYALNYNMMISDYNQKKSLDFVHKKFEKVNESDLLVKPSNEILKFLDDKYI